MRTVEINADLIFMDTEKDFGLFSDYLKSLINGESTAMHPIKDRYRSKKEKLSKLNHHNIFQVKNLLKS